MTIRSTPTCVACGKDLKKRTDTLYFEDPSNQHGMTGAIRADVRSKEDAQRHTNLEVVHVRKHADGRVWAASTWDRHSWGPVTCDGIFCTNSCAQAFGLVMAKRMIADGRIKR